MQKAFFLLVSLALASVFAPAARAQNIDAGVIDIAANAAPTTAVSVSGSTPELESLARTAFNAHGAFRVATAGAYAIEFAAAGPSQVTVTVRRGSGTPVLTQTVSGASARNALLRAADAAVEKITGLRGWFAGRIVFTSEKDGQKLLVTGDLFFGELQSHPVGKQQVIGPRWSPDGSRIVFTSYRTGFPDIYVLDLQSRQLAHLVSLKGTNSGGRFSPDGAQLAMVLSGTGNPEVWIGTAEGKQLRRLTRTPGVEASPAWSPDGGRLVFTSEQGGRPQLYVMGAAGGAMTRVPTDISRYCAEPDWSAADPQKIAFTAAQGRGYQIAVFDFRTGKSEWATSAPTDAIEAVWLPDARHLLCTFRGANTRRLHIVDTLSKRAVPVGPASFGQSGNASYLPARR
ncbi:MAG TPA: biopolymer transporter Tol [Opitutaceae bacterium]|nr:biopolymer transporter Tol [Opitutaceae bacterium]